MISVVLDQNPNPMPNGITVNILNQSMHQDSTLKNNISTTLASTVSNTVRKTDSTSTHKIISPIIRDRFVLQLGTFKKDEDTSFWMKKLKDLGIKTYLEHSKQIDGHTIVLLRAGPFANLDAVSEAISKVHAAGLSQ